MIQPLENRPTPPLYKLVVAFATVYLVWGSTYLAIRFAIDTIPPFLMAGFRFLPAGILLLALTYRREPGCLRFAHWRAAALTGCLMLVGGNGLVCWAEQYVASGLTALLIATVPLWMVLFDWWLHKGSKPAPRVVAGLTVGLVGITILVGPSKIGGGGVHLAGAFALLCACVFWSLGSLHSRRANLPKSLFVTTAMQMICAGVAILILGTVMGEWSRMDFAAVTLKSGLSVAYLSVFGSILALSAYNWLLRESTAAKAATYAYVNPIVAMGLGYALADEPLTPRVILAAAVILSAVIMITTAKARRDTRRAKTQLQNADTPEVAVDDAHGCEVNC